MAFYFFIMRVREYNIPAAVLQSFNCEIFYLFFSPLLQKNWWCASLSLGHPCPSTATEERKPTRTDSLPLPPDPSLPPIALYLHTAGMRRWESASKESGRVAGRKCLVQHRYGSVILGFLSFFFFSFFNNSFKCSNKYLYIYNILF